MFPRWISTSIVSLAALCALPSRPVCACGPFFPNEILAGGDDAVLRAPKADFAREIGRISANLKPEFRSVFPTDSPAEQTLTIDVEQLRESLRQGSTLTALQQAQLVRSYQELRHDLANNFVPVDISAEAMVPAGLPGEFSDYLRGAISYRRDQMADARKHFRALLARPAAQRRLRTIWAAFMIGKSYLRAHPEQAVTWFQRTRQYARTFPDPLGLAAATYGWEAHAELKLGRFDKAIALYLLHDASGDPTAAASLQYTAQRALNRASLDPLAQDRSSREVMTAYILADGGPFYAQPKAGRVNAWLDAIDRTEVQAVAGADRLAWMMYRAGRFDSARRWLAYADPFAPMSLWVNAKLLLREGKIEAAMKSLAQAARAFPRNEEWQPEGAEWEYDQFFPARQVAGELGALALGRGQYTQALDLLIRAGWDNDAAYIAERVLTADELKAYVDQNWPARTAEKPDEAVISTLDLRHLLARRLMRLGRWKDAQPYFGSEFGKLTEEYIAGIRAGYDSSRETADRARSLMAAARIAREHGMELMGTELSPDFATWGGSFDGGWRATREFAAGSAVLVAISPDEQQRISAHRHKLYRRFHYRYIAADLAWEAAALLPDQSEELSRTLVEAGGWLKARDPKAADRFYRALIERCPDTSPGKEALRRGWLPSLGS